MTKTSTLAILATGAFSAFTLTGCMAPGWEGEGTVVELERMDPELEGTTVDHDGLEISVLTHRDGMARSVHVEDCPKDSIQLDDKITVDDVVDACGPIGFSQDD